MVGIQLKQPCHNADGCYSRLGETIGHGCACIGGWPKLHVAGNTRVSHDYAHGILMVSHSYGCAFIRLGCVNSSKVQIDSQAAGYKKCHLLGIWHLYFCPLKSPGSYVKGPWGPHSWMAPTRTVKGSSEDMA